MLFKMLFSKPSKAISSENLGYHKDHTLFKEGLLNNNGSFFNAAQLTKIREINRAMNKGNLDL